MIKSQNLKGPVILVSKDIAFTFPFGYAYLAGYLKKNGENVRVMFRPNNKILYREFAKKIINAKPLVVGFGSIYPDLYHTKELIKILNEEGRTFPIVIGGQMVTPTPEFAISITGADYGVMGEGEVVLYELVKALRDNRCPSDVKGVLIQDGGKIINNGPGMFIGNMSDLPPIPYDLFPQEKWLSVGKYYALRPQPHWHYNDKVVAIHGGRGCPFRCNFCFHHSQPRYRLISEMLLEAEDLMKKFDANMIYFGDDLVIASPERARQLVDGIKKMSRPVEYSISCRFDIFDRISDGLLKELKETGCRVIGLGIESGSQRILNLMNKKITVEQIKKGLRRLKDVGIIPSVSIMVGQITETKEDVEESIALMVESVRYDKNIQYAFTITTPFPGSELYLIAFQKGILKSDADFFDRFNPEKELLGISVNLSNMSDEEVVAMHKKIIKTYENEKLKQRGWLISSLESVIKALAFIDSGINNRIFSRLGAGWFDVVKKAYHRVYDFIQINLDSIRLKLI